MFSRGLLISALVGAVALTAMATAIAATRTHHQTTQTVLTSYKGKRGEQMVVEMNGQKLSLYNFTKDGTSGKSHCYGSCQKVWYPLIDHGKIVVTKGSHINTKQLRTSKRSDGSVQVTYWGQPLYRCHRNTKTGQIYGADHYDFGGSWGVMSTNGSPLEAGSYGGKKNPIPDC